MPPRIHRAERDGICPICGAIVGSYRERRRWCLAPHAAPCGQVCAGGGVGLDEYRLGRVHRDDDCAACEEM